jgi:hypothetical protein
LDLWRCVLGFDDHTRQVAADERHRRHVGEHPEHAAQVGKSVRVLLDRLDLIDVEEPHPHATPECPYDEAIGDCDPADVGDQPILVRLQPHTRRERATQIGEQPLSFLGRRLERRRALLAAPTERDALGELERIDQVLQLASLLIGQVREVGLGSTHLEMLEVGGKRVLHLVAIRHLPHLLSSLRRAHYLRSASRISAAL